MTTGPSAESIIGFASAVEHDQRASITGGEGLTVWLTGLSGSGKSTIAHGVERRLVESGRLAYTLDGDNLRTGINRDLGFSESDRAENVRRVGEIAALMNDAGLVTLVPVISPFDRDREAVRSRHAHLDLSIAEVYIRAPLDLCESRDPKGLYSRARAGEIPEFTGIDSPYEPPVDPDLIIDTSNLDVYRSIEMLLAFVISRT